MERRLSLRERACFRGTKDDYITGTPDMRPRNPLLCFILADQGYGNDSRQDGPFALLPSHLQ
jgi:hypothetical protein